MTQAKGALAQIAIDYEATYGTSPTPGGIGPMSVNKCGLDVSRAMNSPETLTGSFNPVEPFAGNTDVSGDITFPLDAVQIGAWLRAMFGTEVSSVVGTAAAVAVTATNADETFTTAAPHGLLDGQCVTLGGTPPTGLTAATRYYLVNKAASTFQLALSPGGAVLPFTSDGTSVTITTACAHVFKIGAAMPSLVVEKGFPDIVQYFLFNGCKAATFSVEFGGDGELTGTITFKGAKCTASATPYDASLTTPGVLTRLGNFQCALQEAGTSFAKGTRLTLNVDFDLDDSIFCIGGGGIRGDLPQGVAKVSGTLTAMFEDLTLYNKAINATESSIKATLTSSANVLEFFLPEVKYSVKSPPIEGPKGVMQTLDFQGYYQDSAYLTALQTTLVNARATAY